MPKRSNGKRSLWDQADSGAKRRCRRPGGASLSLKASAIAAGTAVMEDTRSPGRASVRSRGATEAAHEAPTKRKVRKMDSLSAATQGPTARILRFVLRCVNGSAERDLESGVENALGLPRQVHRGGSAPQRRLVHAAPKCLRNQRFGAGRAEDSGHRIDLGYRAIHGVIARLRGLLNCDCVSCRIDSKVSINCYASPRLRPR